MHFRYSLAAALLACLLPGTSARTEPKGGRPALRTASFRVRELVCHGCSFEIFKALVRARGFVRVVETNVHPQIITVRYDAALTTPAALARRISGKTGWIAKPISEVRSRS